MRKGKAGLRAVSAYQKVAVALMPNCAKRKSGFITLGYTWP